MSIIIFVPKFMPSLHPASEIGTTVSGTVLGLLIAPAIFHLSFFPDHMLRFLSKENWTSAQLPNHRITIKGNTKAKQKINLKVSPNPTTTSMHHC